MSIVHMQDNLNNFNPVKLLELILLFFESSIFKRIFFYIEILKEKYILLYLKQKQ